MAKLKYFGNTGEIELDIGTPSARHNALIFIVADYRTHHDTLAAALECLWTNTRGQMASTLVHAAFTLPHVSLTLTPTTMAEVIEDRADIDPPLVSMWGLIADVTVSSRAGVHLGADLEALRSVGEF